MDAFNYTNAIFTRHGYGAAIDSLQQIEPFYLSDSASMQDKGMYYQAAMTFYSFAGFHQKAMEFEVLAFPRRRNTPATFGPNDRMEPADAFILREYADAPILLFNEAHSRGQNRAFIRSLLPQLYAKGYRLLALETLAYEDSLINQRRYPVQQSGYYCREAAFGQLIRDALEMGFDVLPYEQPASDYDPSKPYMDNLNRREQVQAENLYAALQKFPDKKIVVLAGHGHIEKKTEGEWIKMAQRLCSLLGRDVPAFDCTEMMEALNENIEHEAYQGVLNSFHPDKPSVLLLGDSAFVSARRNGKVNLNVFFPRTKYTAGYPDWMKEDSQTFASIQLPATANLTGKLLQVYKADEWKEMGKNSVPVLNIEVSKPGQSFDLYLKRGQYYAMVCSTYDQLLFELDLKVD